MIDFKKINTLLFDLDGTLINTEKEFYKAFYDILFHNYSIIINENLYKKCELDKNATLLDTLRISYDSIKNVTNEEIMNKVYSCYKQKFSNLVKSDEVVKKFENLKILKKKGYTIGLVTTCKRIYLNILIETLKIEDLFSCIIAREDVINLKPNSEAYLKALKTLEKNTFETIAIEDSKRGIISALNAGLKVVKVDEYTTIKFSDNRCLEIDSVDELVEKIIDNTSKTKL